MEKILINIEGLNLVFERAPRDQLIDLARKIFPARALEQLLLHNNCYSGLSWNSNLKTLFNEEMSLTLEQRFDLINQIKYPSMRMHQTLDLLDLICEEGNVKYAHHVIQSLRGIECKSRVNDTRSLGYRKLLRWYAEQGDIENFLKTIKVCESGKERHTISRLKNTFIIRYGDIYGGEQALKVAQKKPFGTKFLYSALYPCAKQTTYKKMKSLLESMECEADIPHEDKISLLATSYQNESKNNFDEGDFNELFNSIIDLDPKIKAGDFRLSDTLLMDIGKGLYDSDKLIMCRKAIKNNALKKEIKLVEEELNRTT